MAVNEQVVTGRKFRKLIDEATKLWQRISFWTKASDVEFDDGQTAETKMGAINGITDSLVSTSSNIAASAKALNELNKNLMSHPQFIYDSTGKITGYKTPGGADTVFPFNKIAKIQTARSKSVTADSDYIGIVISATSNLPTDIKINNASKYADLVTTPNLISYILCDGKQGDVIDITIQSSYIFVSILCK